ncbi:esterase E4-like [Planococcus citri]|uniref:esterase E4-like n=1 Tax=Planococcus citri TaxID=170843 RepID=UPI0031F8EBCA
MEKIIENAKIFFTLPHIKMSERVTVTVNEGKVRGFKSKTAYSDIEYYSFLGVPYGESTEGKARFEDPVKVKPWSGVFDATVEKTGCEHFSVRWHMLTGSENCLYNNIHTLQIPTSKEDALKPVIVHIHPGGFFHGSPDPHYYGSPEYIMNHDIVYVSVGHRMHILGYLNLGMKECSGNQALKDIILSLEWIKENIAYFGGDPDNVTLLGSSSGAALVHCILLSKRATGLYHKAVLMGMYEFSPVLPTRLTHIPLAYKIARRLGYDGKMNDRRGMLSFFKKIKAESLIALRLELYYNTGIFPIFPASPFNPGSDYGENAVLAESYRSLIPSTNRVPIIIGFCDREGAMAIPFYQKLKKSEASRQLYNCVRQNKWGWGVNLKNDDIRLIQEQIENFYLDGESIEHASQSLTCDILTDISLSDVYDSLINVVSEDPRSPVYLYKFKYDGNLSVMKASFERLMKEPLPGTFHAADYAHWSYIVDHMGKEMKDITPQDREITDTFTKLITTFARTGNPNYEELPVQWRPTTIEQPSYLSIDTELEVKDELLNGERMEFWHKLKKQFDY